MKLLNFRPNPLALSVLAMPLFIACTPAPAEEAVKNYIAINCPLVSNDNLERNVATLASSFYMFRNIALRPHDIQVNLNGFYATGTSQIDNQIFDSSTRERLGYDLNDAGFVKIASLVKMPTRIDKEQTLQFSERCHTINAVLENEELSRQPQGAFYLLASRKSFIVIQEGSYNPEPSIPVKFKLLNPRTQETEEATIPLHQIIGGDYYSRPSSVSDQIMNKLQNLIKRKEGSNSPQWSISKEIKVPYNPDHPYFTVTKQTAGEVIEGEILNIEFVPQEK